MDLRFVAGLGLLRDEADDVFQFLVGDERALGAFQIAGTRWQTKHVAPAKQSFRARHADD